MNYKRVFWGVILVALGVALVLKNLDIICFSWHTLWQMWPVLLILWGISVLPVRDLWKLLLSLVAIAVSVLILYQSPERHHDCWDWNFEWNDDDEGQTTRQDLAEPYDSAVRFAMLDIDAAAGSFILNSLSDQLIDVSTKGKAGTYSMEIQHSGDTAEIGLDMHPFKKEGKKHIKAGHKVIVKLHPAPVWEFSLDAGAADIDMDLKDFKVQKIDLEGGASSVDITLGSLLETTHVDIEAGASSVKIRIPAASGCQVISNTVLSSRHLKGFDKIRDHTYQTPGFHSSAGKIYIELDAAVSSLEVERY